MMTETGRVVAVEDDCVWVETIKQSTCGSCSAQKGCGHGLLNSVDNRPRNHVRALYDGASAADFQLDDVVLVSIPERVLVAGALLVYIMPLLLMLFAASLANQFSQASGLNNDVFAVLGAASGLLLGFVLLRLQAYWVRNDRKRQPTVQPNRGPAVQCIIPR